MMHYLIKLLRLFYVRLISGNIFLSAKGFYSREKDLKKDAGLGLGKICLA
jgi:hypothetical protein